MPFIKENNSQFSYQVGGSLASKSPSYIVRLADLELDEALKSGEFCYVLNSRQMGKSSLRVRAMEKLQSTGTVCIAIDLTGMGTQGLTPEKWYAGILRSIVSACQIKFDWRSWWRERRDIFTPVQRLSLFIEEILLVEIEEKIVIFIDEIDRVLSQNFSLDDFFSLIHSCYQKRQINSNYHRLTFTLLGVAAPKDLIRNKIQSPFELGKAIRLEGFTLEAASGLTLGLSNTIDPQQTLAEILAWTGGQPFLTQRLCKLVAETASRSGTYSVANLVERYIINDWEVQDEPEHLRTIRDRICYRDSSKTIRLLGLYQDILQQKNIALTNDSTQIELRLSGLVVEKKGLLKVSNPIYARIFDRIWCEQQLAQLRPYNRAIAAWIARDCSDDACLLRDEELQNALTWALGKSLADIDYQFLVASQELAKQEAENTLAAVSAASELLATARKKARKKVSKQRLGKKKLTSIASISTGLVILLGYTGILQNWEWNFLDRFFRWRLTKQQESKITVVTIDERDIKQIGQWPMSDRTLTTAIENIQGKQPKAIAVDIFRDLPVEPGNQELLQLFRSNSHIYAVEKVIGVATPPPDISPQQVGFADQVLDSDGKVRRALLSVVGDDGKTRFSLGTQLALNYLRDREIELKPIDRDRNSLGKAIFQRFNANDGGYVRSDSGGYQVLLNYWGTKDNFHRYSLSQVLKGEIKSKHIRDRLILIGSTAESLKDSFYTPYSRGWFRSQEKMSGVFIHANVASQIISAALNNRPLLRTPSKAIGLVWIFFWSFISTVILWRSLFLRAIVLSLAIASVLLTIACYLAFLSGWWLPLIPALLSLNATAIVAIVIRNRQQERLRFEYTLASLLPESNSLVGKIALDYFKLSENEDLNRK